MLTSGQCVVAAFLTDGGVICPSCADKRIGLTYDEKVDEGWDEFVAENNREPNWSERRQIEEDAEKTVRTAQKSEDLRPLIQYELDSDEGFAETGLNCDDCGEELVAPDEPEEEDSEEYPDDDDEALEARTALDPAEAKEDDDPNLTGY